MKRTLLVASLILLVLILTPVILFVSAFSGNSPVKDRESYASFVTTVKDGFVNSFLVNAGNGGLVLIDAGKDTNALAILSALKERGKSSKDVSAIFLTHGHPDHISGVKAFPSAHVYAMEADVALVEGKVGSAGPMTRLFPPNKLGIKVTDALKDDQVVKIGNRSIRVIAAPGHTPGSAVFIIDGVVFLGDSAGANTKGALGPAPFIFSDSRAQNLASLQLLGQKLKPIEKEILVLLPAHTGPVYGLKPLLDLASP